MACRGKELIRADFAKLTSLLSALAEADPVLCCLGGRDELDLVRMGAAALEKWGAF